MWTKRAAAATSAQAPRRSSTSTLRRQDEPAEHVAAPQPGMGGIRLGERKRLDVPVDPAAAGELEHRGEILERAPGRRREDCFPGGETDSETNRPTAFANDHDDAGPLDDSGCESEGLVRADEVENGSCPQVELFGRDRVVGAELGRAPALLVDRVDRDDARISQQPEVWDRELAEASGADPDRRIAVAHR